MSNSPPAPVAHVDWSRSASVYEVNLRQYTPEGTFAAFQAQLPRLREMGVSILWLMPIQPIGVKNRKGPLGSYYSVSDHRAVNPEFGTLADFRQLVSAVHEQGMHLIIDWVANHTAWDHVWVDEHPEWYLKDAHGQIHSYVYGNGPEPECWTDAVGLDYRQPAVRDAMIEALKFWVEETGIDGYRCDVAGLVPTAFWNRARAALDAVKPVFMLAEWSDPALHERAFDATYDWALHDLLKRVARGQADSDAMAAYLETSAREFPPDAYRLTFTSNHDKNAWEGHDAEVFGPAFEACAVLAATLPGMPLVYGGQESWLDRRLAFFDKDPIDWKDHRLAGFYAGLLRLKRRLRALANGVAGAPVELLPTGTPAVLAYRRASAADALTVVVNLSGAPQQAQVAGLDAAVALEPWAWRILEG
jgi:glycosidase